MNIYISLASIFKLT